MHCKLRPIQVTSNDNLMESQWDHDASSRSHALQSNTCPLSPSHKGTKRMLTSKWSQSEPSQLSSAFLSRILLKIKKLVNMRKHSWAEIHLSITSERTFMFWAQSIGLWAHRFCTILTGVLSVASSESQTDLNVTKNFKLLHPLARCSSCRAFII